MENRGGKFRYRPAIAAATAGTVALAAAAGLWVSSAGSYSHRNSRHWLIEEYAPSELSGTAVGNRLIQSINNPSTYEILSAHSGRDLLPKATHVMTFDSYQSMRSAFLKHTVPKEVKAVLYDNEHWAGTPTIEQRHPFTYVPLAEQLAHAHGLLFMNAPAPDLNTPIEGNRHYNNYSGYIHLRLATLAIYSDIFDIQGQRSGNVSSYVSFTKHAIEQAKHAKDSVTVFCGITTAVSTSQEISREIRATENVCNGYWLNIIGGTRGVATVLPVLQEIISK
jgi:hypothetical protein